MTTPLITLEEAKEFTDIRPTDPTHDARLSALVTVATAEIEAALGLTFTEAEYSETFDTRQTAREVYDLSGCSESGAVRRADPQTFDLSGFLPRESAGIEAYYDPQRTYDPDTLLPASDYTMEWGTGRLTLLRGTARSVQSLRVTYMAGLAALGGTLSASAPDTLKMACRFQTAFLFKRARADNIGHDGDKATGSDKSPTAYAKWNTQQGLCREAIALVRPFRRPLLGRG